MTRKQMINEIAKTIKDQDAVISVYERIRDFLHYNGTPIKDVDRISVIDYYEDYENETTYRIYVGECSVEA